MAPKRQRGNGEEESQPFDQEAAFQKVMDRLQEIQDEMKAFRRETEIDSIVIKSRVCTF